MNKNIFIMCIATIIISAHAYLFGSAQPATVYKPLLTGKDYTQYHAWMKAQAAQASTASSSAGINQVPKFVPGSNFQYNTVYVLNAAGQWYEPKLITVPYRVAAQGIEAIYAFLLQKKIAGRYIVVQKAQGNIPNGGVLIKDHVQLLKESQRIFDNVTVADAEKAAPAQKPVYNAKLFASIKLEDPTLIAQAQKVLQKAPLTPEQIKKKYE